MNEQNKTINMSEERTVMNGKPVYTVPTKTIINFDSGFKHKLLCHGPTFSTGTACAYSCSFCYVEAVMHKSHHLDAAKKDGLEHSEVVVRRDDPIRIMREQLTDRHGKPKFKDPNDRRVIYASPLVDVAANMDLVRETIEACKVIMSLTFWQIRLLSKSNLLPKIAQELEKFGAPHNSRSRIIYGVSTGTLDDKLASCFEEGTPLVSKRIQSLHWLQDNGFRTFGMICPSLPQSNYNEFAREMAHAIRVDRCEHVWAEVINLRGDSFNRTIDALAKANFLREVEAVERVSSNKDAWEAYARQTFEAHRSFIPETKLRFLQYVNKTNEGYWKEYAGRGAVLL